ncbi:glycosyltransferase [Flavobacterium sp.]|uniref:glycosyltransferase family 2 protein n=1 Tax=Flavobacterium sp. TaxID=239 RepID=UPI0024885214|nr:glycosyltransferase [Flavobacterium sp.]MDI1318502.1 glycosyltransferase [Flavobacterium sp.]
MNFTLIICTYMRPVPLENLLNSVMEQTLFPNEILIIDGSTNNETNDYIRMTTIKNLKYFLVSKENRGLTKQRNFGLSAVSERSEVVCFLDDDTVLQPNYFEEIIKAYQSSSTITGVAGIALNEDRWIKKETDKKYNKNNFFEMADYVYPESSRNRIRNILGLQSDVGSGRMPEFSHGRNCGFPLNGKLYEVDLLIGMSFSFRKEIYEKIKFSLYFEGYGLYEDADFSIRAQQFGKNVIATNAQLYHNHDQSGRPNKYQYGKMVVRNGWYVWRVKYPNPSLKARFKWNAITLLLAFIRFSNIFTTQKKKEALTEFGGRISGWISLFINKPR